MIYDGLPDMSCPGIVQQNFGSADLEQGYLAFLSTDIDGTFLIKIDDGTIYLCDPSNRVEDSFEELIEKLLVQGG